MKAVLVIGGFSSQLRPLTYTYPLPLIHLCNESLLSKQLRALKLAGASEVVICYFENAAASVGGRGVAPKEWDGAIADLETKLDLKISCSKEIEPAGTAGALARAQQIITDGDNGMQACAPAS